MDPRNDTQKADRPLNELFAELARETSALVRQEATLARVELTGKASAVAQRAVWVAVGTLLAQAGLLAIVAAAALFLGQFIAVWLAALFLGAVLMLGGTAVILSGLSSLKTIDPLPRQTLKSLKDDNQWAQRKFQ